MIHIFEYKSRYFFSCAILLLAVRRQRDTAYIEIEVFGEMDNVELHSGTRSPAVLISNIIDNLQYIYIYNIIIYVMLHEIPDFPYPRTTVARGPLNTILLLRICLVFTLVSAFDAWCDGHAQL